MKGDDSNVAYPVNEESRGTIQDWKKLFKCIENEDFQIWGGHNSKITQQMTVSFKLCEEGMGKNCHSKETTTEWLRDKYIVLLNN